nr:PadR family transcriptional regulator [Myxococcales bacterium]
IEQTVGQFWRESYGQIYPALKALEAQGCVRGEDQLQGGRRRRVYTLLEAGRARLRGWLAEPPESTSVRNELLLKVFFGRMTSPDVIRGHLQASLQQARQAVGHTDATVAMLQAEGADDPQLPYWLLTLDLGRRVAGARAEWAQHALEVLQAQAEKGS